MKISKKILISILFVIAILMAKTKVEAASATIQCASNIEVNSPITINVSGTGVQWNLELKVDGKTIAKNSELENYEANKNFSFSGTYTPTTAGTKKVTLEGSVTEFSNGATIRSFGSKEIKVSAKTQPPKQEEPEKKPEATKGTITKLVVAGKTYQNPKTDITVKVENDVTKADLAVTTSTGESFTIDTGNPVKLEEGTNIINITLASGKVYTVSIRRAAKEIDEPNLITEEPKEETIDTTLKSLLIKGVMGEEEIELSFTPEFSSQVFQYQLQLDETLADITKLKIEAVPMTEDLEVTLEGHEELKEGENTITITIASKDGKTSSTYQVLVTKQAAVMPISAPVTEEVISEVEEIKPFWNHTQQIVVTVLTALVALLGIIFAIIEYRYRKNEKSEASIPYSGLSEEDKVGDIPFAKVGFEKEVEVNQKQDLLKEEDEEELKENSQKPSKAKKGKHF